MGAPFPATLETFAAAYEASGALDDVADAPWHDAEQRRQYALAAVRAFLRTRGIEPLV